MIIIVADKIKLRIFSNFYLTLTITTTRRIPMGSNTISPVGVVPTYLGAANFQAIEPVLGLSAIYPVLPGSTAEMLSVRFGAAPEEESAGPEIVVIPMGTSEARPSAATLPQSPGTAPNGIWRQTAVPKPAEAAASAEAAAFATLREFGRWQMGAMAMIARSGRERGREKGDDDMPNDVVCLSRVYTMSRWRMDTRSAKNYRHRILGPLDDFIARAVSDPAYRTAMLLDAAMTVPADIREYNFGRHFTEGRGRDLADGYGNEDSAGLEPRDSGSPNHPLRGRALRAKLHALAGVGEDGAIRGLDPEDAVLLFRAGRIAHEHGLWEKLFDLIGASQTPEDLRRIASFFKTYAMLSPEHRNRMKYLITTELLAPADAMAVTARYFAGSSNGNVRRWLTSLDASESAPTIVQIGVPLILADLARRSASGAREKDVAPFEVLKAFDTILLRLRSGAPTSLDDEGRAIYLEEDLANLGSYPSFTMIGSTKWAGAEVDKAMSSLDELPSPLSRIAFMRIIADVDHPWWTIRYAAVRAIERMLKLAPDSATSERLTRMLQGLVHDRRSGIVRETARSVLSAALGRR